MYSVIVSFILIFSLNSSSYSFPDNKLSRYCQKLLKEWRMSPRDKLAKKMNLDFKPELVKTVDLEIEKFFENPEFAKLIMFINPMDVSDLVPATKYLRYQSIEEAAKDLKLPSTSYIFINDLGLAEAKKGIFLAPPATKTEREFFKIDDHRAYSAKPTGVVAFRYYDPIARGISLRNNKEMQKPFLYLFPDYEKSHPAVQRIIKDFKEKLETGEETSIYKYLRTQKNLSPFNEDSKKFVDVKFAINQWKLDKYGTENFKPDAKGIYFVSMPNSKTLRVFVNFKSNRISRLQEEIPNVSVNGVKAILKGSEIRGHLLDISLKK